MAETASERLVGKIEEPHDEADSLRREAESLLADLQEMLDDLRSVGEDVSIALADLTWELTLEHDDDPDYYAEDSSEYLDAVNRWGEIQNWIESIELH